MEMHFKVARAITTVAVAGLFTVACDQPVAPVASSPLAHSLAAKSSLIFRYSSARSVRQAISLPQLRPYPGTNVVGEASVCKDASSPAGFYTFNVFSDRMEPGDLIATSVTIQQGECAIVYSRFNRPSSGASEISDVYITEVIPGGAEDQADAGTRL